MNFISSVPQRVPCARIAAAQAAIRTRQQNAVASNKKNSLTKEE
jgi:hypothetical protein